MSLIETDGLVKTFGDQTAVDGVSLQVARGEVVGFLGPNGAGKSTTMRMIVGFLEPDAGGARICGHDVRDSALEARQHLGYLPEGAPAYGDMTVASFMTFVARMRGLNGPKLNDRLAEMVARVSLGDVWNKPIDALSKGFKRRVGIAQALVHDPDVLILDEPTDGLDPNQKHEMRGLISEIAPDKAIIISTHILEEVEAICTRAVIIARGRVVADETPQALLKMGHAPQELRVRISKRQPADNVVDRVAPHLPGSQIRVVADDAAHSELAVKLAQGRISTADFTTTLARDGLIVTEIAEASPQLDDIFRRITRDQSPS